MGSFESRVGGHITLCFTVDMNSENPLLQGSTGFGMSISKGVSVKVTKVDSNQKNKIRFFGFKENVDTNLYQTVLDILSSEKVPVNDFSWEFDITLELPAQQGFGLSASGACASAIVLQQALGIPESEIIPRAIKVAHLVERKISGGLGDVSGISVGGIERRIKAGLPKPIGPGIVESWFKKIPLILVWKGEKGTHTSSYIDSEKWQSEITKAGTTSMRKIEEISWDSSSWNTILQESLNFSKNSRLNKEKNRGELLNEINLDEIKTTFQNKAVVRLCMLGLSAIILPEKCDLENSKNWLSKVSDYLTKKDLEYVMCYVSQSPLSL